MNRIILAMTLVATLAPAIAQQPAGKEPRAQQAAPETAEFDKQLSQMQENMNTMQRQMEKIQQTQNPQERQRLLQEHWATMQAAMQLMHGMAGPGMRGGGAGMGPGMMGWGRMGDYYGNLTPEQLKQRQYMNDQRFRVHQSMMDQMMQHQYWLAQQQPTPKGK